MAFLRNELTQLEATPEFISAIENHIAVLKVQFEPIAKSDQQDLIEQRAAEIEYWSAMLTRLRLQASKVQHVSDTTKDEAITVTCAFSAITINYSLMLSLLAGGVRQA